MAFGDEIQSPQTASGSSTAPTDTFVSTPTEGNLIVTWVMTGASSITGPSGWTEGVYCDNTDNGDVCAVYFKVAGASESTTVTCSTVSDEWAIGIAEYEGPIDSTPIDISEAETLDESASTYVISPGTTSYNDIMCFPVIYTRNNGNAFSWSDSFTEKCDLSSTFKRLGGAFKLLTTTGTPSTTVTIAAGPEITIGGMVTIKKDQGGGGATSKLVVLSRHRGR